jgi:formylglycine-generating enzyme required for sulfatase activity
MATKGWAIAATVLVCLTVSLGLAEATGVTHLSATVVRIFTPSGTLVVETDDPAVKITVEGDGGLVITGAGLHEVHLKPGSYKLQADKNGQPVPLERELVSITKGGREVVRVKLESPSVLANDSVWRGWRKDAPAPAVAPFDAAQANEHQQAWAKHLGVPVEYTNSIGMKFRLIPPGEFLMGSTTEEIAVALKEVHNRQWRDFVNSEAPQHRVILTKPIYLGVHEVTQEQYKAVMGKNPSHFAAGAGGDAKVAGTMNHSVESVNWLDAAEYCAKLSQKERLKPFYTRAGETITFLDGTGYRLPTEAEWEFACGAGTTSRYWSGDNEDDLSRGAWFNANSGHRTHAIGELAANPFGLFDVHGNVWEWVQDAWEPSYYRQFAGKPAIDPTGPPAVTAMRVIRGGDWNEPAAFCRSVDRAAFSPTYHDNRSGMRVVLSIPAMQGRGEAPKPEPQAFVLLGSTGVAERKFDTLAAAVLGASDTIEVRGNGPFVIESVTVNVPLVIRAGSGKRPVFTLASSATYGLATQAPLVLEGLELFCGDTDPKGGPATAAIVRVMNSQPLYVSHCRLVMMGSSRAVYGNPTRCEIRHCEFIRKTGVGNQAVCVSAGGPGQRLIVEGCAIAGSFLALDLPRGDRVPESGTFRFSQNTFVGGSLNQRANVDPQTVTAADFRLRPDSAGYRAGPDGKDLGADVDLVGPGPAYERWKTTPEYQQWLKETGQ